MNKEEKQELIPSKRIIELAMQFHKQANMTSNVTAGDYIQAIIAFSDEYVKKDAVVDKNTLNLLEHLIDEIRVLKKRIAVLEGKE